MALAIVAELLVAVLLLVPRVPRRIQGLACCWLAFSFGSYHVIGSLNQPGGACRCFGRFLGWLGMSDPESLRVVWAMVVLLGVCGVVMWLVPEVGSRARRARESLAVNPARA
jgi:hypothetical protein